LSQIRNTCGEKAVHFIFKVEAVLQALVNCSIVIVAAVAKGCKGIARNITGIGSKKDLPPAREADNEYKKKEYRCFHTSAYSLFGNCHPTVIQVNNLITPAIHAVSRHLPGSTYLAKTAPLSSASTRKLVCFKTPHPRFVTVSIE
jgi:hypothetical protein